MPWHTEDLVKKGIFYFQGLAESDSLPAHIESFRQSILDFSGPAWQIALPKPEAWFASEAAKKEAKNVEQEANRLHYGEFSEEKWTEFYKTKLFHRLDSSAISPHRGSRISPRSHFYYDSIVCEISELWEVFSRPAQELSVLQHCPKPDITYFLPIYDTRHDTSENSWVAFADQYWGQRPQPCMAEPFAWGTLSDLHARAGLQPGTRHMFNKKTGNPSSSRLKSYPWLIVELKRDKDAPSTSRLEDVVCCQANNAAACALQLQRQLSKHATPLADQAHVQPIPTVTTVGPEVTVWLAYYVKNFTLSSQLSIQLRKKTEDDAYIMRAVWKGNMTKLQHVTEFSMILENIYTWAMRVFKPNVASYLNQWKNVYSRQRRSTDSLSLQSQLEHFETTVPMINAFWKKYKEMEFETSAYRHDMSPVHFGLILQQMVMSDHDKLLEKMGRLMEDKIQSLHRCQCKCSKDSREREIWTSQATSESLVGDIGASYRDATSNENLDIYQPGLDDDEVSTQTTTASNVATSPKNLRRSTRLNKPGTLAANNEVASGHRQATTPATPRDSVTYGNSSLFNTPIRAPLSGHKAGSPSDSGRSQSTTAARTPTTRTGSPIASARSLRSPSPTFDRSLDAAVKISEGEYLRNTPTVIHEVSDAGLRAQQSNLRARGRSPQASPSPASQRSNNTAVSPFAAMTYRTKPDDKYEGAFTGIVAGSGPRDSSLQLQADHLTSGGPSSPAASPSSRTQEGKIATTTQSINKTLPYPFTAGNTASYAEPSVDFTYVSLPWPRGQTFTSRSGGEEPAEHSSTSSE